MKLKQQLIANTIFSAIGLVFSRIIGFILTPYILYKLGVERYAIWTIMASVLNYLTRADLGVATSYTKFISQYYPRQEYDTINKVINSGFVYYAVFGGVFYALVHFGGEWLFSLFRIDESMRTEVIQLFRYIVLIRAFSVAFSIFRAVILGIQRTDLVEKFRMGLFAINALCTFVFLELGYGLRGLIFTTAIVAALKALINIILSYRLVPQIRFNPLLFDAPMFRKMFRYGLHLQLSRMAKIGQLHLSKLFIAHYLLLPAVTVYDIGNRVVLLIRSISSIISPSIIPAASQLHALQDVGALNRLYERASKYMTILVLYLTGFFFCMTPAIILSWIGEQIDVDSAVFVARILLFAYAYYLISDIASVVVLGMGHPEYLMRASFVKLVVIIVGSVLLIPTRGITGAAVAMAGSEIIGTVYFVNACHRELHKSYLKVIKEIYLQPVIACAIASSITFFAYKLMRDLVFIPQGRLQNLGVVAGAGVLFTLLYGFPLLKNAYIDQYDRDLVRHYSQKLFARLGGVLPGL